MTTAHIREAILSAGERYRALHAQVVEAGNELDNGNTDHPEAIDHQADAEPTPKGE